MLKEPSNKSYLEVKDFSVSGEWFQLKQNSQFGFLETTPQPSLDKLSDYYISDDYISHTDAKRNLFEKMYHAVRRVALKQKLHLINKYATSSKQLLDIGCGTGEFLKVAQENKWYVSGLEPNSQARQIANNKTNGKVLDVTDAASLKANSFDVITLWHVLEHVPNLEQQIHTIKTLLKFDGTLIIAVPNHNSFDANYYKSFWAAFDVPRHLWHFNKAAISKLFSHAGFQLVNVKPMYFDAFYVSLLSEKYKTGKMNFLKGIYIGMLSNLKSLRSKECSSLIYILKRSEN